MLTRRDRERWKRSHNAKVTYRTRWRAERRRWQVYLSERNWMQVYPCCWTARFSDGETGGRHWHVGHGRGLGRFGPAERLLHQWRKFALWPFFRLRRRYRVARSLRMGSPTSTASTPVGPPVSG